MEGPAASGGASVAFCDRPSAAIAALLVDDEQNLRLAIDIDPLSGSLLAELRADATVAVGQGRVTLNRLSPHTTMISTTVMLAGVLDNVDASSERWSSVEASLSLAWTVDRLDRTTVELAGAALLTDVDNHRLVRLGAARHHPYNQFQAFQLRVFDTEVGPPIPAKRTGSKGTSPLSTAPVVLGPTIKGTRRWGMAAPGPDSPPPIIRPMGRSGWRRRPPRRR